MADQVPQAPVIPVADVLIPADAPPAAAPPAVNAVPANADNLESLFCLSGPKRLPTCCSAFKPLRVSKQTSVENGLSGLAAYGLRRKPDFDKYAALALAEDIVVVAHNSKHEKAAFLSAATKALRERLDKPLEHPLLNVLKHLFHQRLVPSWLFPCERILPAGLVYRGTPLHAAQGMTPRNTHIFSDFLRSVLDGSALADVSLLAFLDPESFIAGNLHCHLDSWEYIARTVPCDLANSVLKWIKNFVNVYDFFQPFKGQFKGENFDIPPAKIFPNNPSCQAFMDFIDKSIAAGLKSGAISLWGKIASAPWLEQSSAVFVVCYTLIMLGYFIGLKKSILVPRQCVPYLGFGIDSVSQSFTLLEEKKSKFIALTDLILSSKQVDVKTLQRFAGKCISFYLAVPAARLFTNEVNLAISKGLHSSRPVNVTGPLRQKFSIGTS
ncbi:hypothetical protein OS493_030390 [Desmophyllum pertusum]|uniref:Uncharacterized protein n=1 Tax=Desmophyllum pertusum TaxID=174260 RepID=A0A9X0CVK0_9CNID|nr:hypothetical protein OS493_030390 [Desmophyllum pertusum]